MKRFICVKTTEGWGLNPRPRSVLLPLCAHWGPKSPKRHKPVSKYNKHMTLYILLCKSAYFCSAFHLSLREQPYEKIRTWPAPPKENKS